MRLHLLEEKTQSERVNPCKAKGLCGGRRASGRFYRRGTKTITIGCCECAVPMLSMAREGAEVRTSHAMHFGRSGFRTAEVPKGRPPSKHDYVVVPCAEVFRFKESDGTRLYREKSKQPTTFAGCQALENELVSAKLVRHEASGSLGRASDNLSNDLRHASAFSQTDDTFPDLINHLSKGLLFDPDFARLFLLRLDEKSDVRKQQTKQKRAFRSFLGSLTRNQREAIDLVYLENEGQSRAEVAAKIDIGIEALRDRLEQAIKKLEIAFPEYKRQKRRARINTVADLTMGGFFRLSTSKTPPAPVFPFPELSKQAIGKITSIPNRDWLSGYDGEKLWRSRSMDREVRYQLQRVSIVGRDLVEIYRQAIP